MKAIRLFFSSRFISPIILCFLLPLSFKWSTESGLVWLFLEMTPLVLVLWSAGAIFSIIAIAQTKACLQS